jgi:hypothetical protein
VEDRSHRKNARDFVTADGLEAGRGEAAAIRAIGVAAELTRRDAAIEIR